jgi:hypothetical protein
LGYWFLAVSVCVISSKILKKNWLMGFFALEVPCDFATGRAGAAHETVDEVTLFVEQKFSEIPSHQMVAFAIDFLLREELKYGVGSAATYHRFGGHGEGNTIVDLAKFFDLAIAARLLSTKIIGREANNHQLVLVLFVEGLQIFVLPCETAVGGGIYDQYFFAFVLRKINLAAQ